MGPGGVRRFAFPDAGGFMITEETKDTGAPGDAGDSLAALWRAFAGRIGVVVGFFAAGVAFAMQEVIGAIAGWFNIISGRIFREGASPRQLVGMGLIVLGVAALIALSAR